MLPSSSKHEKPAESWAGAETSSARPGSPGLPPPPQAGPTLLLRILLNTQLQASPPVSGTDP